MEKVERASDLVQAFKNFRAEPLRTPEEFKVFYVERNLRVMRQLFNDIEISSEGAKFLLVGYRGSGKSTELRKLQRKIEESGRLLPVSLDIEHDLKYAINDLEIPDLLAYMALTLIKIFEDKKIKVDKELKEKLEETILKPLKIEERQESINANIGIQILSAGGEAVKTFRKEFETKNLEIIHLIDRLIQHLENKLNKPLLLLVDGTDKMRFEKAQKLFKGDIQYLVMPRVRMVVLCPVAMIRSRDLGVTVATYFGAPREIAQMAVWNNSLNFAETDYEDVLKKIIEIVSENNLEELLESEDSFKNAGLGEFLEYRGFKFFYEVTKKRMSLDLIEKEALTRLIIGTGKLSEFIATMRNAISIARAEGEDKVKFPHVQDSIVEIRTLYEDSLSLDDKQLLLNVHEKKEILQKEEDFNKSLNLLYTNHIIRIHAKEGVFWDDINPIYYDRLKRWKELVS